jgi:hypothetical protein
MYGFTCCACTATVRLELQLKSLDLEPKSLDLELKSLELEPEWLQV